MLGNNKIAVPSYDGTALYVCLLCRYFWSNDFREKECPANAFRKISTHPTLEKIEYLWIGRKIKNIVRNEWGVRSARHYFSSDRGLS